MSDKLSLVREVHAEDLPDNTLQEIEDLSIELAKASYEIFMNASESVMLNAISHFHAMCILANTPKGSVLECARCASECLKKTVENFSCGINYCSGCGLSVGAGDQVLKCPRCEES